ncbi:UNKNOWN [Stylonychia lemnae]|uniref:Uncharacterized protein n=1 Tax=Stylonychia lemnae TaxID=5949 RepID=A0A078B666_STYLE|nr:UNKNOWN [Stylonychia lemnae]|eukprot:CDW89721.1 UNKNOWN [Stylonychia lemnae]
MNSSYSDDGRRSDEGKVSLQVEYSDRGKPNYYLGGRISEEEIESERRSTPPGTIGESQDVMSENIGSSIRMLSKKHGALTFYSKSSGPVYEMIKERVPLPNDTQQLQTFKKCYDRLFREFKEKLVHEYSQLRMTYMHEYQQNFQANLAEKNTHISDLQGLIQKKESDIEYIREKRRNLKQRTQDQLSGRWSITVNQLGEKKELKLIAKITYSGVGLGCYLVAGEVLLISGLKREQIKNQHFMRQAEEKNYQQNGIQVLRLLNYICLNFKK